MLRKSHCRFSKYSIPFVAGSKEKTLDLDVENLGLDPANKRLHMKSTCLIEFKLLFKKYLLRVGCVKLHVPAQIKR